MVFLIIFFVGFSVLYETVGNSRTFIILLSTISFSALILLILRYREIYFPWPISFFMFLFLGWIGVGSFFSKDISQTIWEVLRTVSFFALFFVSYNLVRERRSVGFFLLVSFAIVGVLLALKDLYNFFAWGRLEEGRYLTGSFFWHNQMAGFLVVLIPLVFGLFLATRNLYYRFFLFLSIFLLFVVVVLTQSRGGWLSLLVALALFVFMYLKRIRFTVKPVFVLGMFFLISFLVFQPLGVLDKAKSIKDELFADTRTVSGNLRITVWQGASKMIRDNPVFGVGPGAFGSSYYNYQQLPWLYAKNTHNHYLEYAAELGIVGFLLFVGILLSIIFSVKGFPFVRDSGMIGMTGNAYPLLIGAISAVFGSGVHALVDTDWARVSLYSIFWILMAFILAALVRKEKVYELIGIRKIIYLFLFLPLAASLLLGISNNSYEKAKENLKEGDVLMAESNILKAIKFNPYDFLSLVLYGKIKEIQNKPEDAKDIYSKSTSLSVFNSEPLYRIGLIEFEKENYKEALGWFEKAVDLNPYSHPRLYEAVSDTYARLDNRKEARRSLKIAVEDSFPLNRSFEGFEYMYDYTGFKKDLGTLYIKLISLDIALGKKDEAEGLLKVVKKEIDPENPAIPVLKQAIDGT